MYSNKRIETIDAAISRLQAYHDCNHEYMDADDLGALNTTMEELTVLRNELSAIYKRLQSTTTELIAEYAHETDHTFIMEATYISGELAMMECVGWYCGEPNEADTEKYANRQMKAEYCL